MDLKVRLEIELINMKAEVGRCYELAYDNSDLGNDLMYHVWISRSQAFRDCINIIEECIRETN